MPESDLNQWLAEYREKKQQQDDLDYLLSRRPPTAAEKWRVGKTDEEIEESRKQFAHEARLKSESLRPGSTYQDKQWSVSYDEQRDLGLDAQRDLFNDGPGDYGWYWNDEESRPIQD